MAPNRLFPRIVEIIAIEEYSESIKGFFFSDDFLAQIAVPGQFGFLWVPGVDEIPLGFAKIDPSDSTIGFIIQSVGIGTQKLFQMKKGDQVGIRGPFGNGFDLQLWNGKDVYIVGGGVGIAPLLPLAVHKGSQLSLEIIFGAKDEKSLFINKLIGSIELQSSYLNLITEDGSVGEQGTVVDFVQKRIEHFQEKQALFLAAGPEKMLLALHTLLLDRLPFAIWEMSLCDRYIKCGFGICGSCSLDDELGLRLCVEGPVLGRDILSQLASFGYYGRDASGSKKYFE
ncbi:MAG: hypothetical protein ACE5OZ_19090 [Candidatus Heimdallarchaeota archaeon]